MIKSSVGVGLVAHKAESYKLIRYYLTRIVLTAVEHFITVKMVFYSVNSVTLASVVWSQYA